MTIITDPAVIEPLSTTAQAAFSAVSQMCHGQLDPSPEQLQALIDYAQELLDLLETAAP